MPKAKAAQVWDRDPHDWYVEPGRATAQLIAQEHLAGHTHDPCCGQGNTVAAMHAAGLDATGSDVVRRVPEGTGWYLGESDFLAGGAGLFGAENCVMNPPYFRAIGAEWAIRRALQLAPGTVAAFVDARFVFGQTRAVTLYREHPPSRVWIITPRPSCPPGAWLAAGNVAGGGEKDFAWLVWDRHRPRPGHNSELGWLS